LNQAQAKFPLARKFNRKNDFWQNQFVPRFEICLDWLALLLQPFFEEGFCGRNQKFLSTANLKKGGYMKKNFSQLQKLDRFPSHQNNQFFSPWFEDYFEPVRWFDQFINREVMGSSDRERWMPPAIDIDETANEFLVCADLPGLRKEDISIECVSNQLTISAERKYESVEGRKQERRERFYGTFQRSFTLPGGVDTEGIQADYEGGVLTVHIPKVEQAKARKIEIGGTQNLAEKKNFQETNQKKAEH
jgi:HSP20 family protein